MSNSVRIGQFLFQLAALIVFPVLAPLKNRGRKEGDRPAFQTVSASARLKSVPHFLTTVNMNEYRRGFVVIPLSTNVICKERRSKRRMW